MNKLAFCRNFVYLNGKPIAFDQRPYLPAIYDVVERNLVVRASRQVEKSTFLANSILHTAIDPQARILFVCPRGDQVSAFIHLRLLPMLHDSLLLQSFLLGKRKDIPITNMTFKNGAQLYVRSAFRSADACRGLSANLLLIDEVQDIAAGHIPVIEEVMSHYKGGRMILTGTPKLADNHLESFFNLSTANVWTMTCGGCSKPVTIDERALGPEGLICPDCGHAVNAAEGRWVPRNPHATWGVGFSISHPMVPWLDHSDVLQRQRTYNPAAFRNEALGLPTTLGDHVVTRGELEACCTEQPMLRARPSQGSLVVAGIDWGGGAASRTVVVVGTMDPHNTFHVSYTHAFPAREDPKETVEELARLFRELRVDAVAADGNGNGHVYNRILFPIFQPAMGFYGIFYSDTDQPPTPDGVLFRTTLNRSRYIGALFSRVKRKQLLFPRRQDFDVFLDEFACEIAEYDDHARAIKYTHPESQRDDALHATNYALWLAIRAHNSPTWTV